jgi:hypothetical protein
VIGYIDAHRARFGVEPICTTLADHVHNGLPRRDELRRLGLDHRLWVRDGTLSGTVSPLYLDWDENVIVESNRGQITMCVNSEFTKHQPTFENTGVAIGDQLGVLTTDVVNGPRFWRASEGGCGC